MANAPMYLGDDLTTMDSYGKSLLTNSSVVAVDQSGHPAHPVSQASSQQVWFANLGNGSYNVALFNLGSSTATVTANWSNLGFSGSADVLDLWSHSDQGTFSGSFSASVPSHGARLLKVTPGSSSSSGCNGLSGNFHLVNRNSGKYLDVNGDSTADNASLIQFSSNGQADQEWNFVSAGSGFCKIVNLNSGRLINIPGATTTLGTQLIQYHDDNGTNSQWQLNALGGGYYTIVSRSDGQYIDVQSDSTANSAAIVQWTSNGQTDQQWQIVAA